jgi:hypothetical protein
MMVGYGRQSERGDSRGREGGGLRREEYSRKQLDIKI